MKATFSAAPYALPPTDLLTGSEVAELLDCDVQTVLRLIDAGYLPAVRLDEGQTDYRIHAADLTAFATQHGHHEPAAVAEGGRLPHFTPRPLRLVAHRSVGGLLLVTPYQPPVGLDEELAAVKGGTG